MQLNIDRMFAMGCLTLLGIIAMWKGFDSELLMLIAGGIGGVLIVGTRKNTQNQSEGS